MRLSHAAGRVGLLFLFGILCQVADAAAFMPANDAVVLEVVPAAVEMQRLLPLRQQLARHPLDQRIALSLARAYLDLGRSESDPRFVSYAQATLAPWLERSRLDPAILVVTASTSQYLHRFDEALALLDRAIREQPDNGQAWLTKATILQVQGRFAEARAACRELAQSADALIAVACLTEVNSLTGALTLSYRSLRSVYRDDARLPDGVRVWILDELADMAERAGEEGAAGAYLSTALRVAPPDPYSKAAYADLLLRENRNGEVVRLLEADESQDNLLLRLAIAGERLGLRQAADWSATYQARYEAARRDGDFTHLREQARFLLEVRHDLVSALALAERNWQRQREPADIRLLVATAIATRDASASRLALGWLQQTQYEDQTLERPSLTSCARSSSAGAH